MRPDPSAAVAPADPAIDAVMAFLATATGNARLGGARSLVQEKVQARLAKAGVRSVEEYLNLVRDGERGRRERDALIALLTVGETSFFRQPEHFRALRDVVLPLLLDRNAASRELRIWSAGCANGAEPYSIALLLYELLGEGLGGWNVTIVASDINRAVLAEAEAATYSAWTIRGLDQRKLDAFFASDGAAWTLRERYRQPVRLVQHNLVGDPVPSPAHHIHAFDVVFCRNVMLYFDDASNAVAAKALAAALVEGGLLFVAPTDVNPHLESTFAGHKAAGITVYRKKPSRPPAEPARAAKPSGPRRLPSERRRPDQAPRRGAKVATAAAPALGVAAAMAEANRGDLAAARRLAAAALAADPLSPEAHYCDALLLLQSEGRSADAEASLRRALYLDRRFALARYQLALLRAAAGDSTRARKELAKVVHLLSQRDDAESIGPGRDLDAGGLRALARHELRRLGG